MNTRASCQPDLYPVRFHWCDHVAPCDKIIADDGDLAQFGFMVGIMGCFAVWFGGTDSNGLCGSEATGSFARCVRVPTAMDVFRMSLENVESHPVQFDSKSATRFPRDS